MDKYNHIHNFLWYVINHPCPNFNIGLAKVNYGTYEYSSPMYTTTTWAAELILGLHPANERRRYTVTPSLIGWAQT